MLTPFALFFGLTVATAVIAYWSDNLGKKLGKKRISLMGMRPRTTATVLTIASSWGIMLFTLIVMLVVAKPLRDALFRYDSVNQQKDTLAAQRDQLIRQKEEIEKSLDDQQQRLNRVEKQAVRAGVTVRIQTDNAREAQAAAKESRRQQNLAVRREAIARRGAVAASKRAANARQGEIAAKAQAHLATVNLTNVQLQLRQNNQQLKDAGKELLQTNDELDRANQTLNVAQDRYTKAQQKLREMNETLERSGRLVELAGRRANKSFKEAAVAEKEAANAKQEAENAKQEYESAQQKVNELNQLRQSLEQEIKLQKDQFRVLATRPVIVAYNQTLAARTLPRGLAPARIESHLRSLFKVAQETGERLLDNDRVKVILIQESSDDTTKISDDEVYSRAADFIAASNREVSVRVVSISNFAQGEPFIMVRFQMVEVKNAVNAGEVLASRGIDSKIGDAAIFNLLLDLVETGRSEATRRGIKPPQSADDPNFYENGTNEQIFEALRKIEKVGGTPTVSIVATDDLSTVEPIRVRFEVS